LAAGAVLLGCVVGPIVYAAATVREQDEGTIVEDHCLVKIDNPLDRESARCSGDSRCSRASAATSTISEDDRRESLLG
jgi:hypothetical protein